MKHKKGIVAVLVLLAGAMFGLRHGCVGPKTVEQTRLLPAQEFTTGRPQRRNFATRLRWFGRVESRSRTTVLALTAGRLIRMAVADGAKVSRGELLFVLGGPLVSSRTQTLRQQLRNLRQQFAAATSLSTLTRQASARHLATREELTAATDAQARLESSLTGRVQESKQLQALTHIRATVAGMFARRRISTGQDVQTGDILADIVSPDQLYIVASLFPHQNAYQLLHAKTDIDRLYGHKLTGRVTTILPERSATGAAVVWIEGADLATSLTPGETVSGSVVLARQREVLAVPEAALVRDEDERTYLFVKGSKGFIKTAVQIGVVANGWVEIVSGLSDSAEVVERGAYELYYRDFSQQYKVAD